MSIPPSPESRDSTQWLDLTENRPGQAARQKSKELRGAAPFRSALARVMGVRLEERDWRVGAEGEVEVARRLRKLKEGWHVIHAVPVGDLGTDIDHVVIGPPGVFSLNTKNHTGNRVAVTVNGVYVNRQKTLYLEKSRFEGMRASDLLSNACGRTVDVQPLIVVLADHLTITVQPPGVYVVGRKFIAKWLSKRPARLTSQEVEEIFAVARRSSVWRPGAA